MDRQEMQKRIEDAKRLREASSITHRIDFDENGNPCLVDTGIGRDRSEIIRNQKRKKTSRLASKGLSKHHESSKNARFSRDQDFGS